MNIKQVLNIYNITSTGFPAVAGLGVHSNYEFSATAVLDNNEDLHVLMHYTF